jgi:tRNA-specific 2-thiouridylase
MAKVVVAMSGGVDSSVAAALLLEQGHAVTGMMLRLWSEAGRADSNRCCTPEAVSLARQVAAGLGIPFYVLDARDVFRRTVVSYFLDGYARGETPNPCLVCNRSIRWEFLLDHALALGADFMATGHYARVQTGADGRIQLLRGVDRAKDQSYVLHVLDQKKLLHAMFPVGEYTKPRIRELAAAYGLPTAARHDSQDLCFLAGDDYRNFLARNAPGRLAAGNITTRSGQVLGLHTGLANYTIGQRKGLGLESPVPLYVLGKDAATNTLVVGTGSELGADELTARAVSWISGSAPPGAFRAATRIRYTAREAQAEVTPLPEACVRVKFDVPQRDITAGQAAVFFDGDLVLGGGIIA